MQFYLLIATALMVGKSNLSFLSGELHHTGIWEHDSTHVRLFMAPRLRGKWTLVGLFMCLLVLPPGTGCNNNRIIITNQTYFNKRCQTKIK